MAHDLSKFQLFKELTKAELAAVGKLMREENFIAGTTVISENSIGDEVYILFAGEVVIQKALTLNLDEEELQANKALIHLKSDSYPFFGEFAMLQRDAKRTATVRAETDCHMGLFSSGELRTYLNQHPRAGYKVYTNIARVLGERLNKSNHDLLKLTTALMLVLED
jgi:CRP/FNR family cyclic AMP-dependent transcriptional regulator